jgi:flagellar basal-body rod protein FlgF
VGIFAGSGIGKSTLLGMLARSQGFVERANVNPVLEMTKLIMVQHAFEAVVGSLKDSDASLQEAIRTLGATS